MRDMMVVYWYTEDENNVGPISLRVFRAFVFFFQKQTTCSRQQAKVNSSMQKARKQAVGSAYQLRDYTALQKSEIRTLGILIQLEPVVIVPLPPEFNRGRKAIHPP